MRSTVIVNASTVECRPLVCHSDRRALSTARFRRAGLLTTADTCCRKLQKRIRIFKNNEIDSHAADAP